MFRAVAVLALASVVSAYQTDEIFCKHAYNAFTCTALTTNASCAANTACVWDAGTACGLNQVDQTVLVNDLVGGLEAVAASTAGAACAAITTDTACTEDTTCVWSPINTSCMATAATASTALTAASVPAGVQGFVALGTTVQTTCGTAAVSAATCADPNCELVTQGTLSSCQVTVAYGLDALRAKCGTNGAAALAAARAANGITSGANAAAPAVAILATLGCVLALFA